MLSALLEVPPSKRGQFFGKVRPRVQRSDKGGVRGFQKHSKKATAARVPGPPAVVFAGLPRGSAEASVESVGKKAVKAADADHPILHPPPKPKAKLQKKGKTSAPDANDEAALLPSDSE